MSDLYEVVTEELVTALAKAQAEFPAIAKAHINPHYKSKYADLGDVMAAVRPVLAKHGIFTSQPIRTMEGTTYLSTVLYGHRSEERRVGRDPATVGVDADVLPPLLLGFDGRCGGGRGRRRQRCPTNPSCPH